MKKVLLIAAITLNCLFAFTQEIVFEKEIKLKAFLSDKRVSFPLTDFENNRLGIFVLDKTVINSMLFDEEFNILNTQSTQRSSDTKFKTLIGGNLKDYNYNLFFSNKAKTQFLIKSINLETGESSEDLVPIKLKGEKFLKSFSHNNQFYLLTIKKSSSILTIRHFNEKKLEKTKVIDLSAYKFQDGNEKKKLFEVLNKGSVVKANLIVSEISIYSPISIEMASCENKFYINMDNLIFTLDGSCDKTTMIKIDLSDFSHTIKAFRYSTINECSLYDNLTQTNSFLYNNILFQLMACYNGLEINIIDLNGNKLLSSYSVIKDQEISFKNSPIMQKSRKGVLQIDNERELKKTKQLLRKFCSGMISLSVYKPKDNYILTIGSHEKTEQAAGGYETKFTSRLKNVSTSKPMEYQLVSKTEYNPTMYAFRDYTDTKSVYFKSILEKGTFKHLSDNANNKNVFDKINDYLDDNEFIKGVHLPENHKFSLKTKTIFRFNGEHYLGYYNKTDDKYYILKFEE